MTLLKLTDPWLIGVTVVLSLVLVRATMAWSRMFQVIAQPGQRQSHTVPTPAGLGLGLVAALCLVTAAAEPTSGLPLAWSRAVLPAAAMLSIIGWLDDRGGVRRRWRLLAQGMAATALLWFLWPWPTMLPPPAIAWVLLVGIGLVWVMNAYNFMDGSDGLAGMQGLVSGAMLGFAFQQAGAQDLALAAMLVAAACLGYLPWNWPPARGFMGDAGSVPLGWMLAALAFTGWVQGAISLPLVGLVLAVFLVDASLTLARRILRGERWYNPHKSHVYQRLMTHGWSHAGVLGLYLALNLVLVVPGLTFGLTHPDLAWPVVGTTYLLLSAGWCIATLKLGERA